MKTVIREAHRVLVTSDNERVTASFGEESLSDYLDDLAEALNRMSVIGKITRDGRVITIWRAPDLTPHEADCFEGRVVRLFENNNQFTRVLTREELDAPRPV